MALSDSRTPVVAVVMGVCGVGKSTVGAAIAASLGVEYLDADTLHPAANVAKMAAGIPLNDDDRQPWLEAVRDRISTWSGDPCSGGIVACSALKRRYRDLLRSGNPGLRFVYLHANHDAISVRLASRVGHYMPASLLASQLAALEEPSSGEGEAVLRVDAEAAVEAIVPRAAAWLLSGNGSGPSASS